MAWNAGPACAGISGRLAWNPQWFRNRIDAKIVIEQFRRQYNEIRPHSSLGQLTPVEFKQRLSETTNPETAIS